MNTVLGAVYVLGKSDPGFAPVSEVVDYVASATGRNQPSVKVSVSRALRDLWKRRQVELFSFSELLDSENITTFRVATWAFEYGQREIAKSDADSDRLREFWGATFPARFRVTHAAVAGQELEDWLQANRVG